MANPTVKVKFDRFPGDPRGFMIIDLAAFNPKKHVLYDARSAATAAVRPDPDAAPLAAEDRMTREEAAELAPPEIKAPADLTDAQLAAEIEKLSGKAPHPRSKRETREAKLAELRAG